MANTVIMELTIGSSDLFYFIFLLLLLLLLFFTTYCDIELAFDCFAFYFSGLNFATTLRVLSEVLCFHMTSFNYGAKGVRNVDSACRCHQSNTMSDGIFSVNIAQCVICLLVFCFVLFYVCIKG